MIRSMTGYGQSEVVKNARKISIEMKSVNHRFLDAGIRMPRQFNAWESSLRSRLKKYANRGKVDIYISYENHDEARQSLSYNETLASEYVGYLRQMQETFGLADNLHVSTLSRMPEVLTLEDSKDDTDMLEELLFEAFDQACEMFVENRRREGQNLKADLLGKLSILEKEIAIVEERFPLVIEAYRERLMTKVQEVLEDRTVDESRIATEVVLYSDRICTDEELVRLHSHIDAIRATLETGDKEGVGRKLDFLAQELNREANTILSKANDPIIAESGITLKTEIEKIREQIQNIE